MPTKALSFRYDDGVEQDIRLIDIFRQHGLKGTFNINSGLLGRQDKHRRLTEAEVKQVYTTDVCEVACHGAHHGTLAVLGPAMAALDVLDDRRNLEHLFGRQIHGLAYANGSVNETVDSICRNAGIGYTSRMWVLMRSRQDSFYSNKNTAPDTQCIRSGI